MKVDKRITWAADDFEFINFATQRNYYGLMESRRYADAIFNTIDVKYDRVNAPKGYEGRNMLWEYTQREPGTWEIEPVIRP